ncbi:ankyrin repeat domain-containing protein [Burkholderia sp. Ax-1724]|uniref:ankyrin repeat domain-containing protein n=1 Tax=Burkholderia sp. Ax-1724 TaxID=2608336 RepID=UPI0014247DDD|nr:ankyrin repeat domain-containing protein [Burkholderia sp. Ax-1724]
MERLDDELREAARKGSAKSMRDLLARGAGVASVDAHGWTTLMLATASRKVECVKLLLPGVDPTRRSRDRATALMIASGMGWAEGVELLLAAIESRPGGSRQRRLAPTLRDDWGRTPLILAAQTGSVECVRLLLPTSEPNAMDSDGRTALMWAAKEANAGAVECLKALLPASDAGKKDRRGKTALHLAASGGWPEAVELLAPLSDPLAVDKEGKSAFDLALERSDENAEPIRQVLRCALAEKEGGAIGEALGESGSAACGSLRPRTL